MMIILVASAFSGCLGSSTTKPTTTPGTATSTPGTGTTTNGNADVTAVVSGDTITINGVKTSQSDDQNSTYFDLAEGAYLLSWTNTGSYGNIFTAMLENADGTGLYIVSLMDTTRGSSALVVGGMMTPAGQYHLNVGNGGTYSVTITKPTSGDAVPRTYSLSKGEGLGKAVQLNPGEVKISVKHSVGPTGTTSIGLYDLEGNTVASKWISGGDITGEDSGTITKAGVYILDVTLSANTGGEVTISQ